MRLLILGGDGYLGWPTAMMFAASGHDVLAVDNYLRRTMALESDSSPLFATPVLEERARIFKQKSGHDVKVQIADCTHALAIDRIFADFMPDAVVHYAEQPSGPYSMRSESAARTTLLNNLGVTFNVIWGVLNHVPDCHIIKLGTMGEYGTPDIDIEEGWIEIEHKGRKDRFLYPRAAGSLYHTTKVLDTDLLWFYARTYGVRVTDLMQGPVYGLSTPEADLDESLMPNFHYDDIFGTVVHRFVAQAVAGMPLTVYGRGGQTRGYLNLLDTLQCVRLAAENAVDKGQLRIMNQFTELFTVNDLAEKVSRVGNQLGLKVEVNSIANPRREKEEHYYNAHFTQLLELGLEPHPMTDEVIAGMLKTVARYKGKIERRKILPRVQWNT